MESQNCLDDDFFDKNLQENETGLSYTNETAYTAPYYKRPKSTQKGMKGDMEELTCELENILKPELPRQDDVIESEERGEIDEIEPKPDSIDYGPIRNENQTALLNKSKTPTKSFSQKRHKRSRSIKRILKNPLLIFYDNPNSKMKFAKVENAQKKVVRIYPKKEYYRVKFIRKWKKYLRKLKNNQNFDQMVNFKDNYQIYKSDLDKVALTQEGPKTEAKSKRTKKSKFNSFNDKYVKKLFKKQSSRISFELFVIDYFEAKKKYGENLILTNENWLNALCQTFEFSCCKPLFHQEDCEKKWVGLMNFTYKGLILNNEL